MGNLLKRIWASAPVWAWIVMIVGVIVLIVGLIISGNRTSSGGSDPSAAAMSAPTSAAPMQTPATVTFMDDAKANPSTPKTIVLLGDSTGAATDGWAPALGTAISRALDRPVATKFWNSTTNAYGPIVGLGDGPNGAIGFWNGSTADEDVAYARKNLGALIRPEVTPDLILLNFGHTQDQSKPLAPQIQPLVTALQKKYPQAKIAVIKQNPGQGSASSTDQLSGYAADMDGQGIQVIDVYSSFPNNGSQLASVLSDDVNPNAAGQKLWTKTVLSAFGLPTQQ